MSVKEKTLASLPGVSVLNTKEQGNSLQYHCNLKRKKNFFMLRNSNPSIYPFIDCLLWLRQNSELLWQGFAHVMLMLIIMPMFMLMRMRMLMLMIMLMLMLLSRLESHELGVNLLGKTGDRTSKSHNSRIRLKAMYEAGEIDLRKLQRSIGALHSKISGTRKRRRAIQREGGVVETVPASEVFNEDIILDPNTREVLASVTETADAEVARTGARPRRGQVARGRSSRGRNMGIQEQIGRTGAGFTNRRGVVNSRRVCPQCKKVFASSYLSSHRRNFCPGRPIEDAEDDEEEENDGEDVFEDIEIEALLNEVDDLEATISVAEPESPGARPSRPSRRTRNRSSSLSPESQPRLQRRRIGNRLVPSSSSSIPVIPLSSLPASSRSPSHLPGPSQPTNFWDAPPNRVNRFNSDSLLIDDMGAIIQDTAPPSTQPESPHHIPLGTPLLLRQGAAPRGPMDELQGASGEVTHG